MIDMKVRQASSLSGTVALPGDKSISHRAALLAAIATGETQIENFSTAADCHTTIKCLERLGVFFTQSGTNLLVKGLGKTGFCRPAEPLDCGNSGTTARLLAGLLAGQPFDAVLTGDASLAERPMKRIIEPLSLMGAEIVGINDHLPLKIGGGKRLHGVHHKLSIASAQVKSCMLLAGLYADGKTTIFEPTPTRDHTERMLRWFGVDVEITRMDDGKTIAVDGSAELTARDLKVPADVSSAAFFIGAAACLNGSDILLPNIGLNPTREAFINVLKGLGADLEVLMSVECSNEPTGSLKVRGGLRNLRAVGQNRLSGDIIPSIIDEIPMLAVIGTQIEGGIEIRDAAELRLKESDRIAAIVENLRRMNAVVEEFPDGFRVGRSAMEGAEVDSFGDHRIAMAFAVAGILAEGETTLSEPECVNISFPRFFETLAEITHVTASPL